MGTYLFERQAGDSPGRDATASLADDVASALREIDWVDTFAVRDEDVDDDIVVVDIGFEEDWPDIRTSYPDQVAILLTRFGLRIITNPALTGRSADAEDPLAADVTDDDEADVDTFDLFQFED